MIKIHEMAKERFKQAVKHSKKMGVAQQLGEVLKYLHQYANHPGNPPCRVTLYLDFAPHSFSIVWDRLIDGQWKAWFNGGLIYHPGSTGPDKSFSVELNPSWKPHWSIHT